MNTEDEIAALKAVAVILIKISREALARAEATRMLLAKAGQLLSNDYDEAYGRALTAFDAKINSMLMEKTQAAHAEAIRRFLENIEGTKH